MIKRITPASENANSPEHFDEKFHGCLGVFDMERQEKLARYFTGGTYLDVGCNDSPMPILIAERFPAAKVYALDYAPRLIEFLRVRFPKVGYIVGDAMQIPFENESIDYLVAGEIIEHLEDPAGFVRELFRVVKPGGYIALSTPFREPGRDIGGKLHLWRWEQEDIEQLLETKEIEILQEGSHQTILAWRKK